MCHLDVDKKANEYRIPKTESEKKVHHIVAEQNADNCKIWHKRDLSTHDTENVHQQISYICWFCT